MTTQERNQKIVDYYKTHTAPETAKQFKVSVQTVYNASKPKKAMKTKKATAYKAASKPSYFDLESIARQQASLIETQSRLLSTADRLLQTIVSQSNA